MRLLATLVVALLAGGVAHADRAPVTLDAVLAAIPRAPEAQVGAHEIAAAEASVDAAGAWPAPSLHVGTNRLTARLVAGASVPLPIFGRVGAARRVARAQAAVVHADVELVRRDLRHRVVAAWLALARADADVATTKLAAQQAAELAMIAKVRLSAGTGADVDVSVATAARARADVAAAAAARAEDAASAELAGLLGWDPMRPLRAEGAPVTGTPAELTALRARLARHPERAAALRRVAAADASVAQALVERWPSLAVEGEVLVHDPTITDAAGNVISPDLHVGLVLDLPIFAHAGDRARAARETADAERARLAVTDAKLGAQLVATYRKWQAASQRLHAIEEVVLPAQQRAAALSAQAYREGARDLQSAVAAAKDLADVQAELNAARADAAAAFADLQFAVGEEVGGGR